VGGFRACQGGKATSAGCASPKLSIIKGLAFHELGAQLGVALREIERLELQSGVLVLEHPDACFDLFVAQTGGLLHFASRPLSPEARLAVIFAGCVGVADVVRGEDNLPLFRSPIRSTDVWVGDNHGLHCRWKRLPWTGGPRQTRC
jgi:hypothetical protein